MQRFQRAIDYEVPHEICTALQMSVEPITMRHADVRSMCSTIQNLQMLAAQQHNCMEDTVRIHINNPKSSQETYEGPDPCDCATDNRWIKMAALVIGSFCAGVLFGGSFSWCNV